MERCAWVCSRGCARDLDTGSSNGERIVGASDTCVRVALTRLPKIVMSKTAIFSTLVLVLASALAACSTSDGQEAGAKATTSGPGPGSGGGTSSGAGTGGATGGATADASGSGGSFGGSQGGSNSPDASEVGEAGTDAAVLPVFIVAPDG